MESIYILTIAGQQVAGRLIKTSKKGKKQWFEFTYSAGKKTVLKVTYSQPIKQQQ